MTPATIKSGGPTYRAPIRVRSLSRLPPIADIAVRPCLSPKAGVVLKLSRLLVSAIFCLRICGPSPVTYATRMLIIGNSPAGADG